MKVECPTCHLAGDVNEAELPPEGRYASCPRCKNRFHVAKPSPAMGPAHLMNMCPACQYSTFTDEMFAVCPKCGMKAGDLHVWRRQQEERERMRHDREVLTRSLRNPDLVRTASQESSPAKDAGLDPVRVTGRLCLAAGAALLCYGLAGLANYYGKDWQAILSEPLLEPVSRTRVFFSLGFLPWLITLFGAWTIAVASQFLRLQGRARKGLMKCAWGGIAVAAIVEAFDFVNWVRVSSSTPSFSYYAMGVVSTLFMILLWSVPSCALLWCLQHDSILREFPED
jgi:predicted Zn finger-like uncharacterized protein